MLHKTRGIVFRTTKYSETSVITKVYTEKFGIQTYMVSGVRSSASKSKAAIFSHGNLLDMVVYHRETGNMFRTRENNLAFIYEQTPYNIVRSSLMIFYIEILNKTLKEHESNEPLFNCIYNILIELDKTESLLSNHHIWFLLQLAKHFGFYPSGAKGKFFNLREGTFDEEMPRHTYFIDENLSAKFYKILYPTLQKYADIQLNSLERRVLLHHLLTFYRLQLHDFGEIKSLSVLEELFSE